VAFHRPRRRSRICQHQIECWFSAGALMLDISKTFIRSVTSSAIPGSSWRRCAEAGIRSFSRSTARPNSVVQDALSYQKLLDRVGELEALEGIQRGLADVEAGQCNATEAV
jgi:hypothetical protein